MEEFRRSKLYDVLAVSPLIVWYAFGVAGLVQMITKPLRAFLTTHDWEAGLSALSLAATLVFLGVQIILFLIRRLPAQFSQGWMPRLVAVIGANFGLAFLVLKRVETSATVSAISASLIIAGSIASVAVAARLGRAFSILPQARGLVTAGPYRFIRHPLYLSELVAVLGVMLQFQQPWALLVALAGFVPQLFRMHYEERLLAETYPAYREYAAHTARLIPGVY